MKVIGLETCFISASILRWFEILYTWKMAVKTESEDYIPGKTLHKTR